MLLMYSLTRKSFLSICLGVLISIVLVIARFFRWPLTLASPEGFPGAKALQFLIVVVLI